MNQHCTQIDTTRYTMSREVALIRSRQIETGRHWYDWYNKLSPREINFSVAVRKIAISLHEHAEGRA